MNRKTLGTFLLLFMLNAAHGQSLQGKIALDVRQKPRASHPVNKHAIACGQQMANEALLFGKKLELANVVVWLANLKPETNLPHAVLALDLQNCTYRPHVLAVLPGDTLLLRNHDRILHDARGELHAFREGWDRRVTKDLFQNEAQIVFNFVFPKAKAEASAALTQPGLIRVHSTSGHDWMQAYIFVAPHRAFAVSNGQGEFTLPRLPGGKYDLILWHEHLGVKRQLVELAGNKTTELLITWELPEEMRAVTIAGEAAAAMTDSSSQK